MSCASPSSTVRSRGQSRLSPDLEVQRALVDLTRQPGGTLSRTR